MIISRRRDVKVPELLEEMDRVTFINILGVTLNSDLRVTTHVDATLSSCAGSLRALRTLRAHGLPPVTLRAHGLPPIMCDTLADKFELMVNLESRPTV